MNKYDVNSYVEASNHYSEKESPPFALDEPISSRKEQHLNKLDDFSKSNTSQHLQASKNIESGTKHVKFTTAHYSRDHSIVSSSSQHSSYSLPPDLTESAMTDGTSCCSSSSASKSDVSQSIHQKMRMSSSPSLPRHTSTMSSIISTSSLTSIPLEASLPNAERFKTTSASFDDPHTIIPQTDSASCCIGFSELMKAADDSDVELEHSRPASHLSDHRSDGRLPPLLENEEAESGALISAAPEYESDRRNQGIVRTGNVQQWWNSMPFLGPGSHIANRELDKPLLTSIAGTNTNAIPSGQLHITRLLSNDPLQQRYANLALERACASIQTKIESDDSFEISLFLEENAQCTVDDVVDVISNTDLLNLWCNPVETLIVTANSNEGSSLSMGLNETGTSIEREGLADSTSQCQNDNSRTREYEAEWIEATTSSLESPSSGASFIFSAGQTVLQSLGCTSYGKITMFIERRQGRIGLTVGPFNGGIYATHSITVSSEDPISNSGRIRIVDHVRLTHDNEEEIFFLSRIFGCAMGSCISHFFLPSIAGYVDQVTMSMARLRILLENSGNSRSSTSHSYC